MSTNVQPKHYWIGYGTSVLFLLIGLGTIIGMSLWLPHATDFPTKIVGGFGILIGIAEIVEGIRLIHTALKYKKITSPSKTDK